MKNLILALIMVMITGCYNNMDNDQRISEIKKCIDSGMDAESVVGGVICMPPSHTGRSAALTIAHLKHKLELLEHRVSTLELMNDISKSKQ